jgi:uncharacterized protein (TIGR02646 family)
MMLSIGYENISPTPEYPEGICLNSLRGSGWDSKSAKVQKFKEHVKEKFRESQRGRCAFCRRQLGDIRDTHLEHFIEKAAYPDFTFVITNLALTCSTCNGRKEDERKRLLKTLRVRAKRRGRVIGDIRLTPAVFGTITDEMPRLAQYRWIHPHFDVYSKNVSIKKDWIYVPCSLKGYRTVRSLRLNELASMERIARRERLLSKKGLVALLGTAIFAESENATIKTIFSDLSYAIKEQRKLNQLSVEYGPSKRSFNGISNGDAALLSDSRSGSADSPAPALDSPRASGEVLRLPAPPKP